MSTTEPGQVRKQTQSRRRKKRRTEDTSDSSSSSSSSSEDERDNETQTKNTDIDDMDMVPPDPAGAMMDELKASVLTRLKQVPFTENSSKSAKEITSQEDLVTEHSKYRDDMDKKFLQLMTQQFGEDLDELRKKPDFSSNSLMVLAQSLQSGSNLFDSEEINELSRTQN